MIHIRVHIMCRLRKQVVDLENVVKTKQREINHQSQHITELKDLLTTSVQDKTTSFKKDHRMGKWYVCV